MSRIKSFSHKHHAGTFWIREDDAGAWRITLGSEELGAYRTAAEAAAALAAGETYWPSKGGDPGAMGLPRSIDLWTVVDSSI